MAHAHHIGTHYAGHSAFGEWVRRIVEVTREELAHRRVYRKTLSELSSLSNHELADLGLSRSMIRRVAIEAAYGPQDE